MNHGLKSFIRAICLVLAGTGVALAGTADVYAKPAKQSDTSSRKSKENKKSKETANMRPQSINEMKSFYLQAVSAFQNKQYGTALVFCEKAMEAMPEDANPKLSFSLKMTCMEFYTHNNRHEDALRMAEQIRKLPLSEEYMDGVCFAEATTLTRLHRWDDALKKYDECPGLTEEGKAIVASNVAELSMIQGDPQAAAEKYRHSLQQYPDNPHAQFGLSVALMRSHKPSDAESYFLKGIQIDPGFSYLKNAFFEPAYDEDYETAVRMRMIQRNEEALFYLDRYLKHETRMNYRAVAMQQASQIRDEQNKHQAAVIGNYPVLLDSVRTMAVDDTAKRLAFSSVVRDDQDNLATVVWTVNLEEGKVYKRIVIPNDIVIYLAFAGDSAKLRVMGAKQRFELDADTPDGGYLCYDNNPDLFPIGLLDSGNEITAISDDNRVLVSPWKDPWNSKLVAPFPMGIKRIALSHDHSALVMSTLSETTILDLSQDAVIDMGPAFSVKAIEAHPKENIFALGIQTGTLLVSKTGSMMLAGSPELEQVTMVSFSPNGKYLAAYANNNVEVWDFEKLKSHMVPTLTSTRDPDDPD